MPSEKSSVCSNIRVLQLDPNSVLLTSDYCGCSGQRVKESASSPAVIGPIITPNTNTLSDDDVNDFFYHKDLSQKGNYVVSYNTRSGNVIAKEQKTLKVKPCILCHKNSFIGWYSGVNGEESRAVISIKDFSDCDQIMKHLIKIYDVHRNSQKDNNNLFFDIIVEPIALNNISSNTEVSHAISVLDLITSFIKTSCGDNTAKLTYRGIGKLIKVQNTKKQTINKEKIKKIANNKKDKEEKTEDDIKQEFIESLGGNKLQHTLFSKYQHILKHSIDTPSAKKYNTNMIKDFLSPKKVYSTNNKFEVNITPYTLMGLMLEKYPQLNRNSDIHNSYATMMPFITYDPREVYEKDNKQALAKDNCPQIYINIHLTDNIPIEKEEAKYRQKEIKDTDIKADNENLDSASNNIDDTSQPQALPTPEEVNIQF